MHIIAATFLLPVGVTVYTFVGGIKATYAHLTASMLYEERTNIPQFLDGLLPYCHYPHYRLLLLCEGLF